MKKNLLVFNIMLLLAASSAEAKGICHAPSSHDGTRFDRNGLSTMDVVFTTGKTKHGYDSQGKKTDLLGLYGFHDFSRIFQNVPATTTTPAQTNIINNMNGNDLTTKSDSFGKLAFNGKYNAFSAEVKLVQNFARGFFMDLTIPVHKYSIKNITYTDQTVEGEKDAQWQAFMANITDLFAAYDYSIADTKSTDIGDISVLFGYTHNDETSEILDFMDTTIRVGFSIPTGRKQDRTQAFSLPSGYDGHVGIPASFDISLGFYEWMTFSGHIGGQFFLKTKQSYRMKTNTTQNGFVKLGLAYAEKNMGNLFSVGGSFKADHIFGGFSLLLGYSFNSQEDSTLTPLVRKDIFTSAIVNDDELLKKWSMHTFHTALEYDFAQEGQLFNPKVSVFYNNPFSGKRIFDTKTFGGSVGINITWKF